MRYKVFHNIVIMSKIMRYPGCKVSEEKDGGVFLYPITGNKNTDGSSPMFRY